MNFLLSLLWLPVAPIVFVAIESPSVPAFVCLAAVVAAVVAGARAWRIRSPRAIRGASVAGVVYLALAIALVAVDALPGPGTRSALAPPVLHALPAAPASDFLPHANPVLHVLLTGERREEPAWRAWSGGRGVAVLHGALFVIDHPTYGLVIFETSTAWDADAVGLLGAAGLDPSRVRAVVASALQAGPGVAARGLDGAWVMADLAEPRPFGPSLERLQPIRFDENPGFGPFPHYFDLTGDGSILLLSSPGPSPGHVAVLARLPLGPVLLAGDIAPLAANLSSASTPLPVRRAHGRQLGALRWMAEHHPNLIVLPSHDPGPLTSIDRPDITLHRAD